MLSETSHHFGLATLFENNPSKVEFMQSCWPHRAMIYEGRMERLSCLLAISAFESVEALVRYVPELIMWNRPQLPRIARGKEALKLYEEGWTIYAKGIEQFVSEVKPFLQSLENDLGLGAGSGFCNVFASKAGTGANPHFDYAWGFNIQLRGTKSWYLTENQFATHPTESGGVGDLAEGEDRFYTTGVYPKEMPSPTMEKTIGPGSVVFVPRGVWHRTAACEDSFAVSLDMDPKPWLDWVLKEIRNCLLAREQWRECPLGVRGSQEDRERALNKLQALLKDLPQVSKELNVESILSMARGD